MPTAHTSSATAIHPSIHLDNQNDPVVSNPDEEWRHKKLLIGVIGIPAHEFASVHMGMARMEAREGNVPIEDGKKKKKTKGGYTCCVVGCGNNSSRNKNVSYHSFPKNKRQRREWIRRIRRQGAQKYKLWQPTANHRICGAHFNRCGRRGYLDELPTIFPHRNFEDKQLPKSKTPSRVNSMRGPSPTRMYFQSDLCVAAFVTVPEEREGDTQERVTDVAETCDDSDDVSSDFAYPDHSYVACEPDPILTMLSQGQAGELAVSCLNLKNENKKLEVSNACLLAEIVKLKDDLLHQKVKCMELEWKQTSKTIALSKFSAQAVMENEALLCFYTGFETSDRFSNFVKFALDNYNETKAAHGRPVSLLPRDQIFMMLCRLRLGLLEQDLSYRFNVGASTISRVFNFWVDLLCKKFGENVSQVFCTSAPVLLECDDMKETWENDAQSDNHHSSKKPLRATGLVGISSTGIISFVEVSSPEFKTNGKKNVVKSLPTRDHTADEFIIPDNVDDHRQSVAPLLERTLESVDSGLLGYKKVVNLRAHVEKAVREVRNFKILKLPFADATRVRLWKVCCYLLNFTRDRLFEIQ
ncbi:uncharacterized protein LOC135385803 isoform X2 [Ornithodoros turicata]|uniref:uncharacterized protein LOC135385803 isoform X2 n=1 Tax=Ornithodoros turicata TaxID=34597 RepID=UPI003138DCC4